MNVYCVKIVCARALTRDGRETFFFLSRVPVLFYGQFISHRLSLHINVMRTKDRSNWYTTTLCYIRDARSFIFMHYALPTRLEMRACSISTAYQRSPISIECVQYPPLTTIYNAWRRFRGHGPTFSLGPSKALLRTSRFYIGGIKGEATHNCSAGRSNVESFGFMTGVLLCKWFYI
jgi:hypothetical protein